MSADGLRWSAPSAFGDHTMGPFAVIALGATLYAVTVSVGPSPCTTGVTFATSNQGYLRSDVWSSGDGRRWTRISPDATFASTNIMGLAAFGGSLVVVGRQRTGCGSESTRAWISADGRVWQAIDHPAFSSDFVWNLGVADGRLLAVGSHADRGAVWTSSDGRAWTLESQAGFASGTALYQIAVGTSLVVVAGPSPSGGGIWTSSDGTTWIAAAYFGGLLRSLDAAKAGFVGAADGAFVVAQADGSYWQTLSGPWSDGEWRAIASGDDRTIIIGLNGQRYVSEFQGPP